MSESEDIAVTTFVTIVVSLGEKSLAMDLGVDPSIEPTIRLVGTFTAVELMLAMERAFEASEVFLKDAGGDVAEDEKG